MVNIHMCIHVHIFAQGRTVDEGTLKNMPITTNTHEPLTLAVASFCQLVEKNK